MKYISLIILLCFCSGTVLSQDAAIYTDVARGPSGLPLVKKNISLQLTVIKHSAQGQVVYQERHFVTTNYFGIYHVSIGSGGTQIGTYKDINWSDDNYYIQAFIDTSAKSDFKPLHAAQMLRVPYSLYESKVKSAVGKKSNHYIGERFGGGVVYDTWRDEDGTEHGLIVALTDQGDSIPWSSPDRTAVGQDARDISAGKTNTAAISSRTSLTKSAARLCQNYAGSGFHDWYLPSVTEFNLLMANHSKIKSVLPQPVGNKIYWCSTEYNVSSAWVFAIYGQPSDNYIYSKYSALSVRAIRSF